MQQPQARNSPPASHTHTHTHTPLPLCPELLAGSRALSYAAVAILIASACLSVPSLQDGAGAAMQAYCNVLVDNVFSKGLKGMAFN